MKHKSKELQCKDVAKGRIWSQKSLYNSENKSVVEKSLSLDCNFQDYQLKGISEEKKIKSVTVY